MPTAEQVAVEWLRSVEGIDPTKVATNLPADAAVWGATGFAQVTVTGGSPAVHTPLNRPVVTVDCWAAKPGSSRPPWGFAGSMAAAIVWAAFRQRVVTLDLGVEFRAPRVLAVSAISEPRRILDDEAGFARVQVDLLIVWALAEAVA